MSHFCHSNLSITFALLFMFLVIARALAAPPQLGRLLANPAPPFNLPPVADVSRIEEGVIAMI